MSFYSLTSSHATAACVAASAAAASSPDVPIVPSNWSTEKVTTLLESLLSRWGRGATGPNSEGTDISAFERQCQFVTQMCTVPAYFNDIGQRDYFGGVDAALLVKVVQSMGLTSTGEEREDKLVIWNAVTKMKQEGLKGAVETRLKAYLRDLDADSTTDEKQQVKAALLPFLTDSFVSKYVPSTTSKVVFITLYGLFVPSDQKMRLGRASLPATIAKAHDQFNQHLGLKSGSDSGSGSGSGSSISDEKEEVTVEEESKDKTNESEADGYAPELPHTSTAPKKKVKPKGDALVGLLASLTSRLEDMEKRWQALPVSVSVSASKPRPRPKPTCVSANDSGLDNDNDDEGLLERVPVTVTPSKQKVVRTIAFDGFGSAADVQRQCQVSGQPNKTGLLEGLRTASGHAAAVSGNAPLTPSSVKRSAATASRSAVSLNDSDDEEGGDLERQVSSSVSVENVHEHLFSGAVAANKSISTTVITRANGFSSYIQYTKQTLSQQMTNARNTHELERLALILDALDRDGFGVDGNGVPSYVFELVSRMYVGIEAADVSNDYTIIDGLVGQQRVALPIDIIQLINKSRLQTKKLSTKTAYIDADDGQHSTRRGSGGFQYSSGRGRGRGGAGNRAISGRGGGGGSGSGTNAAGAGAAGRGGSHNNRGGAGHGQTGRTTHQE
jgi:uncharacterized membrane protein YgcG